MCESSDTWGSIKDSFPSRPHKMQTFTKLQKKTLFLLQGLLCLLAPKSEHLNEGNFLSGSVSFPFSNKCTEFLTRYFSFHITVSFFLCFPILNLTDYLCWELFSDVDLWDLCKKGQPYQCTYLFGKAAVIYKKTGWWHSYKGSFHVASIKAKRKSPTNWMTKSLATLWVE